MQEPLRERGAGVGERERGGGGESGVLKDWVRRGEEKGG